MHSEGRITAVAVVTLMTSTRLTSVILRHLGSHILVEETPEGVATVAEEIRTNGHLYTVSRLLAQVARLLAHHAS